MATQAALASERLDRRFQDRRPIGSDTTLRDASARPQEIVLHDLSADGCQIETSMKLSVGAAISVGLSGIGRREAEVVRVAGTRLGCRFRIPLSRAELTGAFTSPTVVDGGFATLALATPLPQPVVAKWHPAMRAAVLLGGTVTMWASIVHVALKSFG